MLFNKKLTFIAIGNVVIMNRTSVIQLCLTCSSLASQLLSFECFG